MASKPLIAVTGPDTRFPIGWYATQFILRLLGADAMYLTPANRHLDVRVDGLVIGGGDDIDPSLYGESYDGPPMDVARDELEICVIEQAIAENIPTVGICRGAQLINVVLGGTLYPDIRPLRKKTSNRRSILPTKVVSSLSSMSRAEKIFGQPRLHVNSLHYQAIKYAPECMRVVYRDGDNFPQCIELTQANHFLFGVQWHPEYLPYLTAQRRLFRALVDVVSRNSSRFPITLRR